MRNLIPKPILDLYHYLWAYLGALVYRFPSRKLFIVGVTGTKGKSTTAELVRSMFAEAGHKVALASTIRFAIDRESEPNLFKMTMPGHAYLQQFLRRAVDAGCTHAVLEMTSEGAKQFRHIGIELDALIFTNLAPEHLESHGGMEAYAMAKLSLASHLEESTKRPRYIVANIDDAYGKRFLAVNVEARVPFSLHDAEPHTVDDTSARFIFKRGEVFTVPLPGLFNIMNVLATLALGEAMHIPVKTMKRALEKIAPIAGRAERIERGQTFTVIVDYAHTPDSIRALFETYRGPSSVSADETYRGRSSVSVEASGKRLIAVMGSTGGGRDQWKRPEMGRLAEELADIVYLTNEDPYDEDPQKIVDDIAKGFTIKKPRIVLNRRDAIAEALREAKQGDVVLVTGKGTDPYIMGPRGSKKTWSDRLVAEEELDRVLSKKY